MYRVKITNPWYDSKNQFFIVKVSTTWIPIYFTIMDLRINVFSGPSYRPKVFPSKEEAEDFVQSSIPDRTGYREYQSTLSLHMEQSKEWYRKFWSPWNNF